MRGLSNKPQTTKAPGIARGGFFVGAPKIDLPESLRMRKRWVAKAYDAGRPARRFAGHFLDARR